MLSLMITRLRNLTCEERLKVLFVLSLEKIRLRKSWSLPSSTKMMVMKKKVDVLSPQGWIMVRQGPVAMDCLQGSAFECKKKQSLYWDQLCIEIGCPEKQMNLLFWKYKQYSLTVSWVKMRCLVTWTVCQVVSPPGSSLWHWWPQHHLSLMLGSEQGQSLGLAILFQVTLTRSTYIIKNKNLTKPEQTPLDS